MKSGASLKASGGGRIRGVGGSLPSRGGTGNGGSRSMGSSASKSGGGGGSAAQVHRTNQLNPCHANYWLSRGIEPRSVTTAFHGTSDKNATTILKQGFKPSTGGLLGSGTYVTTDVSKAQDFAGSEGAVVKVMANFGSVKTVDARPARQGGYSETAWQTTHDTAYVPQGEGVARPEHCIKDARRLYAVGRL